MNTIERSIVAVGVITSIPVSLTCVGLIVSYLNAKPSGMQTFNDRIMTDFLNVFAVFTILALVAYSYGSIQAPVGLLLALTWSFAINVVAILFLLYLIALLILKYISIYHSILTSGPFDEDEILTYLRFGLLGLSFFLEILEVGYLANPSNLAYAQVLLFGDTNDSYETGPVSGPLTMLLMFMVVGLHIRIEYDNIVIENHQGSWSWLKTQFQSIQVNPTDIHQEAIPYRMSALRVSVVTSIVFVILAFILVPIATSCAKVVVVISTIYCLFVGIPIVFIWSHPNIKAHSIKKARSMLCTNNSV
jgi:hypothetical protein